MEDEMVFQDHLDILPEKYGEEPAWPQTQAQGLFIV